MNERECMKKYNIILKHIEKHLGKTTTYSDKLHSVGKKLLGVKFKGVFPSDKIPKLNDLSPYCIVNVDNSKEAGSHWMSIVKSNSKSNCILYDSFGRRNTMIIPSLRFSGNGKIIDTDRDAEQKIKEENCGARAISWLVFYDKYGEKNAMKI